MSEQKSAQLQVTAQDHRIRELSAELTHVVNNTGFLISSAEKTNTDLQAARSELAEYRTQIDAMNQHALNMQKLADSQKKDFEAEIEKLRREQRAESKISTSGGNSWTHDSLWSRKTHSTILEAQRSYH